jgi:hypothetical protein
VPTGSQGLAETSLARWYQLTPTNINYLCLDIRRWCAGVFCLKSRVLPSPSTTKGKKLLATDLLALAAMKNAANREM